MMSEEVHAHHQVPSDISQIPIVWRYELLKYLRSWRLYGSMIIVFAIVALLYLLPPLLGEPYSGTDTQRTIQVVPAGTVPGVPIDASYGFIERSQIDTGSLVVYLDDVEYPSADGANWVLMEEEYGSSSVYMLVFLQDEVGDATVTASYEWYISPESFESLFLGFVSFLIIICATFFGADAIVSEFQNRTGYLVFPNPMKRSVLFLGKFGASLTAGLMVVTIFYGVLAALSLVSARGLDDDLLLSFAFAAEYLVAAIAVAYLISSVLKGSTGALVLTFFMFLMILPIVDNVSAFSGVKIEGSLTFSSGVITYILQDPYPVDEAQDFGGFSLNIYYPDQALAALTMAAYAFVSLGLGMYLFNRKQLAG
jgi:ABC-2 type transport system permease protein